MQNTTIFRFYLLAAALVCQAAAFLEAQSNASTVKHFIAYQQDITFYPYTVHLPDRTTRNLSALTFPPPLLLSLSGSGARGPANESSLLSGYDGASRKIREYNDGQRTLAHTMAAEEFLTVTPICPDIVAQSDANWNTSYLPNILAQVAETYEVDLTRVYLSSYSMGSRASWDLLINNPNIFAGAIISSGATHADSEELSALLGIPIRNYVGTDDEDGLANATQVTMNNYATALAANPSKNSTGYLSTIYIDGADHLTMTDRPWDEDVETDGLPGALSWLIKQQLATGGQIPGINFKSYGSSNSAASTYTAANAQVAASTASAAPTSTADTSSGTLRPSHTAVSASVVVLSLIVAVVSSCIILEQ